MTLHLTIVIGESLRRGTPLLVEIRDTSVADAPAVLVKRVETKTQALATGHDLTLTVALDDVPSGSTIWAHVDVDGDGRVSKGDFITVESYPVRPSGEQRTTIRLRKVT